LSEDDRYRLGRMLVEKGVLILEDDSYGLLRYEGEPIPTMFELSERTIVYSTSFSHTIAPGLRVGVFIVPDDLAADLAAKANSTYITPVLLGQATAFEFMRRGSFEPNLEHLTGRLAERRDAMHAALEKHFEGSSWYRPEGGIFILLRLPPGTNSNTVLERAEGVSADAGADLNALPNSIRLNFAGVTLEEIEPGIERLAAAFGETAEA
jgi:2-aminoadipate transaminase